MSRQRRHHAILDQLAAGPVQSHAALGEALRRRGIEATQATLSRDLRELGVVKARDGYRLPEARSDSATHRDHPGALEAGVLRQHVVQVSVAAGLLVVRTTPGSAGIVALHFDRVPPAGVVGTVAGDDTVFLALRPGSDPGTLANRLSAAAGLRTNGRSRAAAS
ncbi:MAG: hypothetical protein AAGF47_02040 [Planctomycetota bacterium]